MSRLAVFSVLFCMCFGQTSMLYLAQSPTKFTWHTTPDKWREPRVYESEFDPAYNDRLSISHEKAGPSFTLRVPSPNKAYWFAAVADWPKEPAVSCNGAEFESKAESPCIYVSTEREYLLKVTFKRHDPNYTISVRWVNERLLYLQVWWGRVLGSAYLLDVENEIISHKEMIHDGSIDFEQWQQGKNK